LAAPGTGRKAGTATHAARAIASVRITPPSESGN
jgi:hypothetical protein